MPEAEISKLFSMMAKLKASDLHLKAGAPPIFRVRKTIRRMEVPPLSKGQVEALVSEVMDERQKRELNGVGSVDFTHSAPGVGRFRMNVFKQRGSVSAAIRRVEFDIPTFEELHLPEGVRRLGEFEAGVVLVGGVTGSGKSTTLACLVNEINHTRRCHILTIEDPIEYLYRDAKAFINQREVGIDVESYHTALKYMVRQDPDVILIGEMRDAVSFETALQAAETGHLVFGTIHAASAPQTITRILDLFPQNRHHQIRQMLFFSLRGVAIQKLLRGARKDIPLVPAIEVMIVNPSIRKLIHNGEDGKLAQVIRASREEGMQTMNQALVDLVKSGLVKEEVALENSPNPEALRMNLRGIYLDTEEGGITG